MYCTDAGTVIVQYDGQVSFLTGTRSEQHTCIHAVATDEECQKPQYSTTLCSAVLDGTTYAFRRNGYVITNPGVDEKLLFRGNKLDSIVSAITLEDCHDILCMHHLGNLSLLSQQFSEN